MVQERLYFNPCYSLIPPFQTGSCSTLEMLPMDCLKLMRICEKNQGVKIGQFTRSWACRPLPTLLLQPRQKNVGNMWRRMCQGLTQDLTQSESQVSLENPIIPLLPLHSWESNFQHGPKSQSCLGKENGGILFRWQLRDCNGYWWLITENIQHFCIQLKRLMDTSPRGTKQSAAGSRI